MKRSSLTGGATSRPSLGVSRAILVGWLVVNLPAIFIMLGVLLVGAAIEPRGWWLSLIAGFSLGWAWWSYTIPRWRRWALNRGVPADRLRRWAVAVGLTWPRGWVFERTESKMKE